VQATGFVEHLKLPHYVDFQAELALVRQLRKALEDYGLMHVKLYEDIALPPTAPARPRPASRRRARPFSDSCFLCAQPAMRPTAHLTVTAKMSSPLSPRMIHMSHAGAKDLRRCRKATA